MHKEYEYPAHRCPHPSRFFDKDYVVNVLTQAFHLIFGLSVGIGIGMVMCGVTRAIIIVIISALGYLSTETEAWFYLPACIFRLIRNDYPNKKPFKNPFSLHLPDDFLGEKDDPDTEDILTTDTDTFCKFLFGMEKDRQDAIDYLTKKVVTEYTKKSGTDTEETPNITEMEEKEDGGIQSEDDGGSGGMV